MPVINPYLNFKGNCEEAFNFYKSIFGGEFTYVGRFSEMPEDPNFTLPEEVKNKIMHISLPISKETVLMGSDSGGDWAPQIEVGNNISVSITASSKEEADRLFNALGQGGKITMPLEDAFWGDYFGMLIDKYEINWMMSYNPNFKPEV